MTARRDGLKEKMPHRRDCNCEECWEIASIENYRRALHNTVEEAVRTGVPNSYCSAQDIRLIRLEREVQHLRDLR